MTETSKRPRQPSPERVAEVVLKLAQARGAEKTIGPTDVARALGGDHPDGWGPLMPAVRRAAVSLMKTGRVVVLRKGVPVDPEDFRGVYRIRLADQGEGSSAELLPESR